MENVIQTAPQTVIPTLYKAAAVSVIALSVAGIGAMTGYLPVKKAEAPQSVIGAVQPAPAVPSVGAPAVAPVAAQPAPAIERAPKPRVIRTTTRRVEEPSSQASPVSTHPVAVSSSGNDNGPYGQSPYGRSNSDQYPQSTYPSAPYPQSYPVTQASIPAKAVCVSCGTIESVREIEQPGAGSGIGAVGGAVGGAVLGKQFGNGRGSDALAILGAIGGGLAGHQIEKKVRTSKSYEVVVRMEDGSLRSIPSTTAPNWRTGDRVKVEGGAISPNYS